jgi:penicillin-binding protein 1A
MAKNSSTKQTKKKTTAKQVFLIALFSLITLAFLGSMTALGVVYYFVKDLEYIPLGDVEVRETSFILDVRGEVIAQLHDVQNRITVPLEAMPQFLVDGVVAMEDHRFYSHYGFSPRDFIRAAYLTLTKQDFQGASTISQQVARNRILQSQRVTIERKIQEIYTAFLIEKDYSKKEILETYVNELFMGGSAHGMQAAAQQYFAKDVGDINIAEAAMLVGLIPSPNAYSPTRSMTTAKNRQALVLSQMVRHGVITEEERQSALEYEIVLARGNTTPDEPVSTEPEPLANYFADYVAREVQEILMKTLGLSRGDASVYLHRKGLTVQTTLDMEMQRAAEKAMHEILTQRDGINDRIKAAALLDDDREIRELAKDPNFIWQHPIRAPQLQPQVAMMIMDPPSGQIKVWVGGRDIFGRHGIDRIAGIQNQPGSAIKPLLVYGPALASGRYTAASVIDDAPVEYPSRPGEPPYAPRNYAANTFYGLTSIRAGLAPSHNVMAVKLLADMGIRNSMDWAESLGIESFVKTGPSNDVGLASGLGGLTDGVTLYEMVRAFNVFNNRGVLVEPNAVLRITAKDGTVLYQALQPKQEIVISEQLAWLMTDILQDTIRSGTGTFGMRTLGKYTGQAAGKTGTTNSNVDAMFIGYTPAFTAGVWIGHDDSLTGQIQRNFEGDRLLFPGKTTDSPENWARGGLPHNVGSGFATSIFGRTLTNYYADKGQTSLPAFDSAPRGIVEVTVCTQSGLRPSPLCTSTRREYFIEGTAPQFHEVCDIHVVVDICLESGELANEYCPPHLVNQQVRFIRQPYAEVFDRKDPELQLHPNDVHLQVPFQECTLHGPPEEGDNDSDITEPGESDDPDNTEPSGP